jgi:hypothetical protein
MEIADSIVGALTVLPSHRRRQIAIPRVTDAAGRGPMVLNAAGSSSRPTV